VTKVVRVLEIDLLASEDCLEPLLDGLLGVEAENTVRNLGIGSELSQGDCILSGLAGQKSREFVRLKFLR
jgi:hypothetical protein